MKSISPVIATILLIVISVSIAGLTYAFLTGMFNGLISSSNQQITKQTQYVSFNIVNSYCSNGLLYFIIDNNGNVPININNAIINIQEGSNILTINGNNTICNNGNIITPGSSSICYINNSICLYNSQVTINPQITITYNGISESNNLGYGYIIAYFSNSIPIIIYNSQSISTPSPFQQDIAICNGSINLGNNFAYVNNPNLFNQINSNGSNVLYFDINGNLLYSWYEGQENINGVLCDVWWVNIPNGIPANSNITIYMGLGNSNVNYYQYYPYVGANPFINNGTYGSWDNGFYVFLFYDNFANLNQWNIYKGSLCANISVNTTAFGYPVLYMYVSSGMNSNSNSWCIVYNTSISLPSSFIIDVDTYLGTTNNLEDVLPYFNGVSGSFYVFRFDARDSGSYNDAIGYYPSGGTSTNFLNYTNIASPSGIWLHVQVVRNQNGNWYLYKGGTLGIFGNLEASTNQNPVTTSGGIGLTSDGAGPGPVCFDNLIVRSYPPNGVMPSIYIS